ncbi:MAG TPA: hypothetical protein VHE54_11005 [Puia sp.]|nr:hypothetical protein [Puia sp.]
MAKLKLRGKDLRAIGYPEGPVISIAMNIMGKNYKFEKEEEVVDLLKKILAAPVEYANDAVLGLTAQQLIPKETPEGMDISPNTAGVPFKGEPAALSSTAHGAERKMSRTAAMKTISQREDTR